MNKILYEKYDVETGAYLYEAEFFEEGQQPLGYTSISKGNFVKAFLDIENQVAYETGEPIIIVPQTILQMNMRLQLISSGITIASIYAMIDTISDSVQKEIVYAKWEYAAYYHRTDVTLNQMATALGLTQLQVDNLFINGNKI